MDRKYPLETQLLSRSHTPQRTQELLRDRHSPYLPLHPTTTIPHKPTQLLLSLKKKKQRDGSSSTGGRAIKRELRRFISRNKALQHLYKFKKNTPQASAIRDKMVKFEEYLVMNKLWVEYAQNLLLSISADGDGERQRHFTPLPLKAMLQKLSGAEYVGCFLHVLQSRNRDVVGKAGIVVLDTMKFFVIVEEDEGVDGSDGGALKMLMKEGSVFNFVVPLRGLEDEKDEDEDEEEEVLEFSIVGSRVCYRSDDRATRKFKARASDDLSALLMKQ